MTRTAILDTTIVADALLRRDARHVAARSVVPRFERRLLPVYALKEFKRGPLYAYVWLHDTLRESGSVAAALDALAVMARTQRRNLASTALEALAEAERAGGLVTETDARRVERLRLALWRRVVSAWRARRSLATEVIYPLACYQEVERVDGDGSTLSLGRLGCEAGSACAMATTLSDRRADLERLKRSLEQQGSSRQRDRMLNAIAHVLEHGAAGLTESQCLSLGDAVFAILCPNDAVIVTTNVRDHEPLAAALGKRVERPDPTR